MYILPSFLPAAPTKCFTDHLFFLVFEGSEKKQKVIPHPKSIIECSAPKARTYQIMKAGILISLAALNRQVDNYQGQPLNIEGPQRETCRESDE